MTLAEQKTTYDEVPYASHAFAQSHPDRLATIAQLFGLRAPPPSRCRLLEIGCAGGGNILPIAWSMPQSEIVGIDLSQRQIAEGRETLKALGLKNVELHPRDILEVDERMGKFDYIICHGVFSWVPKKVQEKILKVCSGLLTPNGVAYVSYNTYPGWHMTGMLRDMMNYHASRFADPKAKVQQARALVDFLAQSVEAEHSPYAALLKQELAVQRRMPDHYIFHEHLEKHNEPLYFHEFARRASDHGLQYLGDSSFGSMWLDGFPTAVQETLRRLANDIIHREQYMDFVRNRTFRTTLLCHGNVRLERKVSGARLESLYLASAMRPKGPSPDLRPEASEEFGIPGGLAVTTADPLFKAAMLELSEVWPEALAFADLRVAARARVGECGVTLPEFDTTDDLSERLLRCYTRGLLEARVEPARLVSKPGERPEASAYARHQAQRGPQVTNLRHETVALSEPLRAFMAWVDGTADRAALRPRVDALLARNEAALPARDDASGSMDPAARTDDAVEALLGQLARLGLLVSSA